MGAQVAPAVINIDDSDMTHEFVFQSRVPACAANSRLPLQHQRCYYRDVKKKKAKIQIQAKAISFLNIFSFGYESEGILSGHGSSGSCSWVFATES